MLAAENMKHITLSCNLLVFVHAFYVNHSVCAFPHSSWHICSQSFIGPEICWTKFCPNHWPVGHFKLWVCDY